MSPHKIVSGVSSNNKLIDDGRLIFDQINDQEIPEVDFDSLKQVPIKTFQIMRKLPTRRSYSDRREYLSHDYMSSVGNDAPAAAVPETPRKSVFSAETLGAYIEHPTQLRTGDGALRSRFIEGIQYPDEELEWKHRRWKTDGFPGHSRHTMLQELVAEDGDEFPRFQTSNFGKGHRFLRRNVRPRPKYSGMLN